MFFATRQTKLHFVQIRKTHSGKQTTGSLEKISRHPTQLPRENFSKESQLPKNTLGFDRVPWFTKEHISRTISSEELLYLFLQPC